jgi:hypothetical protein
MDLAEEFWETKGLEWPGSSFGQILITFTNDSES